MTSSPALTTADAEARFAEIGTPVRFRRGQTIFEAGVLPDRCYFLKSGIAMGYCLTEEGTQHYFGMVDPGEIVLCQAMFSPQCLPKPVLALTACEAFELPQEAFLSAIGRDEALLSYVMRVSSAQYLRAIEFIHDIHVMSADRRLCRLLLRLSDSRETPDSGLVKLCELPSQQILADILDVNRITVVRAMKLLRETGVLQSDPDGTLYIDTRKAFDSRTERIS